MSRNNKCRSSIADVAMCAIIVLLVCVMGYLKYAFDNESESVVLHTDTIYIHDTTFVRNPIATDSMVVRYKKVFLRSILTDSVHDTIFERMRDTMFLSLPIIQKEYSDSTYKAWISGYDVKLDSILIFRQHQIIKEDVILPASAKRFYFGLQGGVGITPRGVQPYIGIGVSYNIFLNK